MVSTKYLIKLQRKLKRLGSYKTPPSVERLRKDFEDGKAFKLYGVRRYYPNGEKHILFLW